MVGDLINEILLAVLIVISLSNRFFHSNIERREVNTRTTKNMNEIIDDLQRRIGQLERESVKKEQQIQLLVRIIKNLKLEAAKVPVLQAQIKALQDELARQTIRGYRGETLDE